MLISNNANIELHIETTILPTDPNSVLVKFYSIGENSRKLDDRFNKFEFIANKDQLKNIIEHLQEDTKNS